MTAVRVMSEPKVRCQIALGPATLLCDCGGETPGAWSESGGTIRTEAICSGCGGTLQAWVEFRGAGPWRNLEL